MKVMELMGKLISGSLSTIASVALVSHVYGVISVPFWLMVTLLVLPLVLAVFLIAITGAISSALKGK